MTLFEHDSVSAGQTPRRRGWVTRLLVPVLALVLVAAGVLAYLGFQRLVDQYTVWTFRPSSAVSRLIESSQLTDKGRFIFLASTPKIESSATFASSCSSNREGGGILGCYLTRDRSIHLFAVTEPRLLGLTDVVATHEMLHAVWDRLSAAEQRQLVPLLEREATKLADDPAFQARLTYYATNEPGERDNELHSIIGTEIASISPELEAHYAKWLGNRQSVVKLQVKTDAVFSALENRSADLSATMNALQGAIAEEYASYTSGYTQLNADTRRFNARTDFTTNEEIYRAQRVLESRRSSLDGLYADILAKTAEYNANLAELKILSEQTAGLNSALNQGPTVTTIPTPAPAGSG
ncbi:hypothetical protein [Frigoribacterium sp. CG_9.8]|uniref:hypothetical protein n=1 Tax=Frigoribacterium sp. CG_9.8 TaxID=2787733 RepID=UPI0018CA2EF4|nr:hypothetical protein [Frigoribacterium sp. CG_9.8]MBG6107666.1 hypothetical protein [Frigoribacterium sp. CG_9.8]